MGFFSDLKEDITQAVNEMALEESKKNEAKEQEKVAPAEPVKSVEPVMEEEPETSVGSEEFDLDALLEDITSGEQKPSFEPEAPINAKRASDENALITAGMSVVGDIVSAGSLEIFGSVKGNIAVNGKLNVLGSIEGDSQAAEIYAENANITGEVNSQGSVKVGQSSVIIGNIFATSAVIAGAVKGDIDVKGPVILDTSAIVMGNIKSKSVQINNGAVIEGICSQCYAEVNPTSFFDDLKKLNR